MMKRKIVILALIPILFLISSQVIAKTDPLPEFHLIKGSGPEVYVLERGLKRWVPDPETFNNFNFNWQAINAISDTLLGYYPEGDKMSKYDDYPDGSLVKGSGPEVYLVELGKRRWITSPSVFEKYEFQWSNIIQISDSKLNKIKQTDNVSLAEPNRYPETFIIDGPAEGENLDSSEITFKFSGTNPLGNKEDLTFETFLRGYDTKWHRQYSDSETYKDLEGDKKYTFYVRAKNEQGYYDLSPAWRNFQVGVSPNYGKVTIRKVSYEEDNFTNDYLVLRNNENERINITGWYLTNKKNEKMLIPQAAEELTYPYTGSRKTDINLDYRDEVIVSAGKSPKQVNFRTNVCTGYLDNYLEFYPSLDKSCPYIEETKYSGFKRTCRDFIDRLDRCEMPDYSNNYDVSANSECTDFLNNNFSYDACYNQHSREIGFFEDEWRIFLGKTFDLFDNYEDEIVLRDKNGYIVDEYQY